MPRTATIRRTMPDLRAAVQAELRRRKWSAYRLVQSLKGKRPDGSDVPPTNVYKFLRGETAINSDDLGIIFEVLEIDPRPRQK